MGQSAFYRGAYRKVSSNQAIGRKEVARDVLVASLIDRFSATIGNAPTNGCAPLGIHWCLAPPNAPMSELGDDGHPRKGGFLPDTGQPRRMWASSNVEFIAPLRAGDAIERTSTVAEITEKTGSSGRLTFVRVDHAMSANGELAVREAQTIVYRDAAKETLQLPPETGFEASGYDAVETIRPTPPLLFRYSALTFNTHRIHYDEAYAKQEEKYPGLVVHGPLTASLLLRLASEQLGHGAIRNFTFAGKSPAFCGQLLHLCLRKSNEAAGETYEMAAHGGDGRLVMSATVGINDSSGGGAK